MTNRKKYIKCLQTVIRQLHGCDSTWEQTVPVIEEFRGQTVWDGDVEVFKVNHPNTDTAYAWSDYEGQFTAVLRIPPATDPQNAVNVSIVAMTRKRRIANPKKPKIESDVQDPPDTTLLGGF